MKENGFCEDIIVFNNGQEAIDGLTKIVIEGKPLPSIIFLDLNMPIMNGWEFLKGFTKIPNKGDKVTIYILSSSVDPRNLKRIKDYSIVSNYILKPFTPEDLQNVLKEVA